jgi:hypothetical protein
MRRQGQGVAVPPALVLKKQPSANPRVGSLVSQRALKVAIVCVTDLHCNDQNYPKIEGSVAELSRASDTVILVINGDIVTKIQKNHGRGSVVVRASGGDSHVNRMQAFERFLRNVFQNQNVQIILNLGNHEFMHPDEVAGLCQNMNRNPGNGRFHVVSNVPGQSRFQGLVQPSVLIGGIAFVGYCTADIYRRGDTNYAYAQEHGYVAQGGRRVNCRNHNQRFTDSIRRVNNPVVFILSHEARDQSAQYVWPMVTQNLPTNVLKFILIGHDHGDWRPDRDSTRPYNIFNNYSGFQGARSVIIPEPFGRSMEIVEMAFVNGQVTQVATRHVLNH